MLKAYYYFSLFVIVLVSLLVILGVVLYITVDVAAPEVMEKITSSIPEIWQTMPAWMRIGVGIFLALVGIVVLPVCFDLLMHAPFGESSRLFGEEISRDFYHGP